MQAQLGPALCDLLLLAMHPEADNAAHYCRGAVAGSHMQPHITHSVWAFCWGISVLQRTTAHPPIAMLQDLQVPDQADSARARADLPASMDGTVCMTLLLVACAESLLCLAFWPRPQTSGEDMAGTVCLLGQSSCCEAIVCDGETGC